jgi:Flp pilus assembly CpaE family ATPase
MGRSGNEHASELTTGACSELEHCNALLDSQLAAELAKAAAALSRGDRNAAGAQLTAIDTRFGGLAAPRILELDARLSALR